MFNVTKKNTEFHTNRLIFYGGVFSAEKKIKPADKNNIETHRKKTMNIKLNLGEIIMRQKNQNKKRRYNIKQQIEITYYETNERVNIVEPKRI